MGLSRLIKVAAPFAAAGALILSASAASAAKASPLYDDSRTVYTTNGCGAVDFVDYGTWPNGSTNDDYAVVHDYCADGYGVTAYAWLNGVYLGSKYNGNGYSGSPVYWDPFGNVAPGDLIGLKVCLGSSNPFDCHSASWYSVDG